MILLERMVSNNLTNRFNTAMMGTLIRYSAPLRRTPICLFSYSPQRARLGIVSFIQQKRKIIFMPKEYITENMALFDWLLKGAHSKTRSWKQPKRLSDYKPHLRGPANNKFG